MARISIKEIGEAFTVLFDAMSDREFRKTTDFRRLSERQLLAYIRFFLLGWFDDMRPEAPAKMTLRRSGRFDFLISNTAVEVAVRASDAPFGKPLSLQANSSEVTKLLKHDGPSVLVLLDLCRKPTLDCEELDTYYDARIRGKGNHKTSSFTVLYFHRDESRKLPQAVQVRTR